MLLLVALLSLLQPESQAAAAQAVAPSFVILGDDGRRATVERVLGDLATAGGSHRQEYEGGLFYVGCVTAWRDNGPQTEACIRARIRRQGERPTVVLNAYQPGAGQGTTSVSCIGIGGTGRAIVRDAAEAGNAAAMLRCLDQALQMNRAPWPRPFGVRFSDRFEIDDVEQARATATTVLRVAIDHVGYPRGMTGSCLVQGRVARVERGPALLPGGQIELGVPCGPAISPDGARRVRMTGMGEGRFARIYLGDRRTLLHIEQAPR
jgi:hypothetical protein